MVMGCGAFQDQLQEGQLMAVVMHRAANAIRVKHVLYTRTSRSHFPPL